MRLAILAFAAGVIALQYQAALPPLGYFLLGGAVLLAVSRLSPRRWRTFPILLASAALGFGWAAWRAEQRLDDALPMAMEGRDVEVIGVVAGLPQGFANGNRFEFAVEQLVGGETAVPRSVILSWYRGRPDGELELPPLRPGERWRLTVRLKRPHGNANPGGFDYEAWLLERNIRATGYVRPGPGERLDGMVWRLGYVVERLRDAARSRFLNTLPAERYPLAGILVALAVGDQKAVNGELWSVFNRTGTTHLMSISGLHVTMVAALFGALVGALWRRVPSLAIRLPAQQAAIAAAGLAAFGYACWLALPCRRNARSTCCWSPAWPRGPGASWRRAGCWRWPCWWFC